jgi:serine/threonine-protein kinase
VLTVEPIALGERARARVSTSCGLVQHATAPPSLDTSTTKGKIMHHMTFNRFFIQLVAVGVAVSACASDTSGPDDRLELDSHVAALSGGCVLTNAATNFELQSLTGSSEDSVLTSDGPPDVWVVQAGGIGGAVQLVSASSGRCLDSDTQGEVYGLTCNGGSFQQWLVTEDGDGVRLRNLATQLMLDSDTNGDVYTEPNNGGQFQLWTAQCSSISG